MFFKERVEARKVSLDIAGSGLLMAGLTNIFLPYVHKGLKWNPVDDFVPVGLVADLSRVASGHPMPALGEGRVCEHCDARGLCRKDFWSGV